MGSSACARKKRGRLRVMVPATPGNLAMHGMVVAASLDVLLDRATWDLVQPFPIAPRNYKRVLQCSHLLLIST